MADTMNAPPAIDGIDARRLDLIRKTVAKDCTDAEIASFLELAARYDLDPFAREIWCVKNKSKLLIMVGRDGLRKVALRQGFGVDGDVVRAKDEFRVQRTEHGRVIHHAYGMPEERGAIVGAWCQVTTIDGRDHGYFYAPLSEYRPAGVNEYSPWAKQTSVMILAAAERQALRQATPLAGLLAEGEDESARAQITAGEGDGDGQPLGLDLGPDVENVIARATELGHAGLSDRASIEVALGEQPPGYVADWCRNAQAELDALDAPSEANIEGEVDVEGAVEIEGDALVAKHSELLDLIADGEQQGDVPAATMEALRIELAAVEERLGPDEQIPGQEGLPL